MRERNVPVHDRPLSVGELTRYLKYVVESDEFLSGLSVQGEICELSRSGAGHVYFTLKDEASQVACVLFRREAMQQAAEVAALRKGTVVVVHGFFTLYEPRGTGQIYVERVLAQGEGAFFRRFEELKSRLEREGLFAAERKRALPQFPRTIALLTAQGSQAYHDVLRRLRDQYPFVKVVLAPVAVQGDHAPSEIVMALDIVNRLTNVDVILIVRGGGAPEDLAAFNDERLARAIFASRIPVITGVGHEQDYTIVDYVADFRAPTPSLAAAAAVPDISGLRDRAIDLQEQLAKTMQMRLRHDRVRWVSANRALLRGSPQNRLRTQRQRADELALSSRRAIRNLLASRRARMERFTGKLGALDPLAILARGYAVLTDVETGRVVSRTSAVHDGRALRARVADGEFTVRVEE